MSGLLIEGGVYFLLLFTPFAFGGVEMWAIGVVQIVAGVVFVAWALGEGAERGLLNLGRRHGGRGAPRSLLVMWIAIALFILLVAVQLLPLPPSLIQMVSPGVHHLYARTLPGYAEGRGFDSAELPSWLLSGTRDRIPGAVLEGPAPPEPEPSPGGSAYPPRASAWRTLSIFPFQTRQNLTILLCYAGLFIAISGHFRTKDQLARLVGVAVFAGFAVSLFGIIQKLDWNGKLYWLREGEFPNPFGPFVNRNSYAAFAGTILPAAVCIALSALRGMREGRRNAASRLLFFSFMSVVMAGGIFFSLSRGGMIAAALSILLVAVFLIYFGRHGMEVALLGILVAAAAGFLVWIGPERVIERAETISQGQTAPSLAVRVIVWERSLDLIADNLLFGTGLGTFRFSFMRYAPPGRAWWTTAHNEYVEILCDTGVIGGAIILVGVAAYLLRTLRPARFRDRSGRYAYAGIVAGIAGLLLHSTISSNLQVPANGVMFVVLTAALLSLVARQSSGRARHHAGRAAEEEDGEP